MLQEPRRAAVDRAETAFVPDPALGSGPKSAGPSSTLSFCRESSRGERVVNTLLVSKLRLDGVCCPNAPSVPLSATLLFPASS